MNVTLNDQQLQTIISTSIAAALRETKQDDDLNLIVGVTRLSKYLGISRQSTYDLIKKQKLSFSRIGNRMAFKKEDVKDLLNKTQSHG